MSNTNSLSIRNLIFEYLQKGISQREISRILTVPPSTVNKIAVKIKNTGTIERKKGSGIRSSLSNDDKAFINSIIDKSPKIT